MSLNVMEGTDGSGKSTQMKALCTQLAQEGIDYRLLDFPRYDKPSGYLAKQYLNGAFGSDPRDVNPYAASTFYAVDRIASYLEDWRQESQSGRLILTDRFTTANAVHQASKFPELERADFFEWLFTFEYDKLGLPRPDMVLFLDMPVPYAISLLQKRSQTGDIHETDAAYLEQCRATALKAASLYNWKTIACANEHGIRSAHDIHQDVLQAVHSFLRK